jgi:hypothetical protein
MQRVVVHVVQSAMMMISFRLTSQEMDMKVRSDSQIKNLFFNFNRISRT